MVTFSNEVETPAGTAQSAYCYARELAQATPLNKAYLKKFVAGIQQGGSTIYSAALKAAYNLFMNTPRTAKNEFRSKFIWEQSRNFEELHFLLLDKYNIYNWRHIVFIQPGVKDMSTIICAFKVSGEWY